MAQSYVGGEKLLEASIYEYVGGPLIDPDPPISVDVSFGGNSVLDSPFTYPGEITRVSTGRYEVTWDIPSNAPSGYYVATWTITLNSTVVTTSEEFYVAPPVDIIVDPSDGILGETYILTFGGIFDPMYVDPDEIIPYFADYTDYLEVAELIHQYSLDVASMLKLTPTSDIPYLAYEYVKAATLCSLSRLYPAAAAAGFGNSSNAISLGDFRVESGTGNSSNSSQYDRGNASDWCQLAEALRKDLLYTNVGMRAVVKASIYRNPIPNRELKSFDSKSVVYYGELETQGQLDGPAVR